MDPDPERVRRLVGALAREGLLEHSRSGYHLPR
ncbi:hypothetical protein BN11_120025 [Nostocoides australiense Ben110]|uniref:Dam-replacing protein HTH domain-containing protein n=1 Tax=Nostocoides australiense Ben110 TaxID=1193182 RepID=W6JT55_9MICO|nr:hypothetical protein BN11_120025 [Tetrasphaera australiensis Ben110]